MLCILGELAFRAAVFKGRRHTMLQGVLWVLDMYLASDCPDYRFTYEREGPSAGAIIEAAAASTAIRRKRLPQVLLTSALGGPNVGAPALSCNAVSPARAACTAGNQAAGPATRMLEHSSQSSQILPHHR
jgi:hypothetical protein